MIAHLHMWCIQVFSAGIMQVFGTVILSFGRDNPPHQQQKSTQHHKNDDQNRGRKPKSGIAHLYLINPIRN